jgi:hypothetical protein
MWAQDVRFSLAVDRCSTTRHISCVYVPRSHRNFHVLSYLSLVEELTSCFYRIHFNIIIPSTPRLRVVFRLSSLACYIVAHLIFLDVIAANIARWPSAVFMRSSEEGASLHNWQCKNTQQLPRGTGGQSTAGLPSLPPKGPPCSVKMTPTQHSTWIRQFESARLEWRKKPALLSPS